MATDYLAILRRWWGYESFRGVQLDIIRSIGDGRDTLGLMPTGGGKSITFQVPAMATEGVCLVITPLIALMKDQVDALRRRGIKATAIHTGLTQDEIAKRLDNCLFGDYKFLYVSPERLGSEFFRHKLRKMPVSFITVDEAHCISQWGYDFRPAYLDIAAVRSLLPGCPVLALTATATPTVIDDIQERLGFRRKNAIRMSFARPNLSYVVRHTDNKEATLLRILEAVPGAAIVYTRSRQHTYDTARWLNEQGISAQHYHAGLTPLDKDLRQRSWQDGETRVIVATNAFGMGIDKPDVRAVVHLDAPIPSKPTSRKPAVPGATGCPPMRSCSSAEPTAACCAGAWPTPSRPKRSSGKSTTISPTSSSSPYTPARAARSSSTSPSSAATSSTSPCPSRAPCRSSAARATSPTATRTTTPRACASSSHAANSTTSTPRARRTRPCSAPSCAPTAASSPTT